LPSLTESKWPIFTFDKQFDEASVGSSITIELENDINVTRGDMIVNLNCQKWRRHQYNSLLDGQ
jgi:sulfate adenylyltransferase subunit 1 (EFTu-like GTPase family)